MSGKSKKIQILNTSDEAAKYVKTIEGWVDRHGYFHGKDERHARWAGCTHIVCPECGTPTLKNRTICDDCSNKKALERYRVRECKPWDSGTPLYSETADKYFFYQYEIYEYIEETGTTKEDLRLRICEPNYLREIDEDYFYDDLPDEGELPQDIINALEPLNEAIRNLEPISWSPGRYAADLESI